MTNILQIWTVDLWFVYLFNWNRKTLNIFQKKIGESFKYHTYCVSNAG